MTEYVPVSGKYIA